MSSLLATFYFFYFSIIGVYIIFIPKILSMSGYSAGEIGIIFAAGPMIRFLLPFAFTRGLTLNLKSFKIALIILILGAISFYNSIDNFYKILFSSIIIGIGLSLILPYIELLSLSYLKKERYGKIRLFGSIGFVLVALVLVKFLSSPEVALTFLLSLMILTAAISFIIAKNISISNEINRSLPNDINLLSDWRLWGGLTLMQVSFGAYYNFFTIYETDFGLTLDMSVYLWSFGVLCEIFMLFFQAKLLQKNLLLVIQISILASALRWFLIFLFPQNLILLFFAQTLHAFSFALFHSAAISYLFYLYKHKSLAQQFFSGIT